MRHGIAAYIQVLQCLNVGSLQCVRPCKEPLNFLLLGVSSRSRSFWQARAGHVIDTNTNLVIRLGITVQPRCQRGHCSGSALHIAHGEDCISAAIAILWLLLRRARQHCVRISYPLQGKRGSEGDASVLSVLLTLVASR